MTATQHILLAPGQTVVTESAKALYLVGSGTIEVHLAPLDGDVLGRRMPLCDADEGDIIPSLAYRDADYRQWRFVLVARTQARLGQTVGASSAKAQEQLLTKIGIQDAASQRFGDCLVDRYRKNSVKDEVFLLRSDEERKRDNEQVAQLVAEALEPQERTLSENPETARDLDAYRKAYVSRGESAAVFALSLAAGTMLVVLGLFCGLLFDKLIARADIGMTALIGALLAMCLASCVLFHVLQALHANALCTRSRRRMRDALLRKLFSLNEGFVREQGSSALVGKTIAAGETVARAVGIHENMLASCAFAIPSAIFLVFLDPAITGCIAVLALCCSFAAHALMKRAIRYQRDAEPFGAEEDALLLQLLEGIEAIRASGAEQRVLLEYLQRFVERRSREATAERFEQGAGALATFLPLATLLVPCVAFVLLGSLTPGTLAAFALLAPAVCSTAIQLAIDNAELRALEDRFQDASDLVNAKPELWIGGKVLPDVQSAIEFDGVSFSYEPDAPLVLDDVSFRIQPGQSLGIVGESGSGKSTLLSLILGFNKPDAGSVLIDGTRLDELDIRAFRKSVGAVMQDERLVSGTIYENVTLAKPNASKREVLDAIAAAGLADDVAKMPMGLFTLVGEGGSALSGGQRQRILIARAFIRKPAILLFDEATSSLDATSQKAVMHTISSLHCTKVIVAHRLSTIADCDTVLTLEKGHLASGKMASPERIQHEAATSP